MEKALSVGEDMNIHHNYIFNTANGIQFESDYDFTKISRCTKT